MANCYSNRMIRGEPILTAGRKIRTVQYENELLISFGHRGSSHGAPSPFGNEAVAEKGKRGILYEPRKTRSDVRVRNSCRSGLLDTHEPVTKLN